MANTTANNKTILLFHVEKGKSGRIQTMCRRLGIRTITVPKARYHLALGTLLHIGDFPVQESPAEEFAMEMMVFSGLTSEELDLFLKTYKESGIAPIPLKAIVTPTNVFWSAARLYRELTSEYFR